jgi:sRNA-binding regulator protein Hfq
MKATTQAELDALPPAEREIQNRLIREGRIRVVSPGEKGKEKGPKAPRVPEPLEALKGKQVRMSLVNGTSLEGALQTVSRFECVLTILGRGPVVILKHALALAEEMKAPGAG